MTRRYPLNSEYRHPSSATTDAGREEAVGTGRPTPDNVNAIPQTGDLLALAREITSARVMRKSHFPTELFGEPAWDMLLALYQETGFGRRITVSNLCRASESPSTTALRWIERLEELKMVTRRKNPLDARIVFIELAPEAHQLIEDYLMRTWVSTTPGR